MEDNVFMSFSNAQIIIDSNYDKEQLTVTLLVCSDQKVIPCSVLTL